jgi:valyl-tRNA synthetase
MKTAPAAFIDGISSDVVEMIRTQSWFEQLHVGRPSVDEKSLFASVEGVDVHLPLGDLMDAERLASEVERMKKESEKLADELGKLEQRLQNPQFAERAKPEVVEEARNQAADLKDRIEKLADRIILFGG